MKQILTISALAVAIIFFSSCKSAPTSPTSGASTATDASENIEQTMKQMENEWENAVIKNDSVAVERLLSDDFMAIDWDGQTTTKAQMLEQMKAAPKDTPPAPESKIDDLRIHRYGDTAVVQERHSFKPQGKDEKGNEASWVENRFTNVWVKKNGQWQMVAAQGSSFQDAKP